MNKIRVLILIIFSVSITQFTMQAQRIFVTDSIPKPDLKVFITSDSLTADMKVCLVDSVKKVYKDGIWFMVSQYQLSNLSVKFVTNPYEADLRIFYVSQPKQAGWIDTNKRFYYRRKH